jgi:hypothetical protein
MSSWTAAKRARYGGTHRAERRRWAPLVAAGKIRCARCNEFIFSDAPWDLDHLPGGGRVPSHRRCNRQTMLHNREPPLRVSREW